MKKTQNFCSEFLKIMPVNQKDTGASTGFEFHCNKL